jgi:uncharacterized membrane protein YphA (DoxX/SURF4 family)
MKHHHLDVSATNLAGLFTLSLRWVIGWTYFSAFWRRLILDNKLIPDEAGYIGEKFNHFLPNALGIKPIIEYLVTHPEALHISMIIFTIVEAIVGLFLIIGLYTRLMSVGVFFLAMGILLGSGWLGTTCLDEWQIGILGLAGGFTLFLTGSSAYSLDDYMMRKRYSFTSKKWFTFVGSGPLPLPHLKPTILTVSLFIFGLTLYTNQYFHGGVLGKLHNKSVRPKIEIADIQHKGSQLTFQIYRVEGADVYGSFMIGIQILDADNKVVKSISQDELAQFPKDNIHNHYVAKIKPGKHSLIVPLGAKADLKLDIENVEIGKDYTIKLIDISGIEWSAKIP